MTDDLGDAIKTNAQGPKSASGDSGSMQQHALPEVIEADKHLLAKDAVAQKHRGIRFSKLLAPGAT
jgi:hypothetical protein